jgi:glycosyltransferase involved in cell wall biosynthesis
MKILHLLHQYLPEKIGGTELYTRTLARMQVAAGHEVAIFSPAVTAHNWPEPALEDGAQVFRLALGPRSSTAVFQHTFRQPTLQKNFQYLLEKNRPDIVHIQHLMGLPTSLINQITSKNIPFVITLHDYWYICANAQLITNYDNTVCQGPNWWLNCAHCALARAGKPNLTLLQPAVAPLMAFRNFRLKNVLGQARQLIAPTNFVRETYTQLGIDPTKIAVIPHGIRPPENGRSARSQTGETLRVVYIGGLAPQKGVHILIDAVNRLVAAPITLNIYGDMTAFPDYVAGLQAQVSHSEIHFNGRLPHEALWDVLAQSDVVVVPSLWYETASLIIQEAFAAGVPVIASNIGALRERVQDGIDGRLFPVGDAAVLSTMLDDLRRNPEKLARLATGIQPVSTIDQHQQAIEKIYQLVLTPPSAV